MKTNYKNQYDDHNCQLCNFDEKDQSHIFNCETIIDKCEALANNVEVEYEDLFANEQKQIKAIKLLFKMWETRKTLLTTQDTANC